MANTKLNDAASLIMESEINALTATLTALKTFDDALAAISLDLGYPENFRSDARRITSNLRSMVKSQIDYEIPNILSGLQNTPAQPPVA